MAILEFPPLESADRQGLLAVGGDLEVSSLLLAYRQGIFPWPIADDYLTWFSPPKRAVVFLEHMHISTSLKKERRKNWARLTINQAFAEVVESCAELTNRKDQEGTWITPAIKEAYLEMHRAGYAHSIECWERERLVGGVYGVSLQAMFAAESMFFRKPNASKFCLWYLHDYLTAHGVPWFDIQMLTPHMESMGAREIPRKDYIRLLNIQLSAKNELFRDISESGTPAPLLGKWGQFSKHVKSV